MVFMNTLLKDLRNACRILIAARAFTIAALLSLAIGIGANTAIFSIVDGLLLRPLPYADADQNACRILTPRARIPCKDANSLSY